MSARSMLLVVAGVLAAAPLLSGADGGCGYRSLSVVDGGPGDVSCGDAGNDAVSVRNSETDSIMVYAGISGIGCDAFDNGGACPDAAFRIELSEEILSGETFDIDCPGVGIYPCDNSSDWPENGTITVTQRDGCLAIALDAELSGDAFEHVFMVLDCGLCGGTGAACDHDSECCAYLCDEHLCAP